MRRVALAAALIAVVVLVWSGLQRPLQTLLVPRLQARLGAPLEVERVTLAWPPALSFRGVHVTGPSVLRRAREIRVGMEGVVLAGAVLEAGRKRTGGHPSATHGAVASHPATLPRVRLEDSSLVASWGEARLELDGLHARPHSGGWRVTARQVRVRHNDATLRAGPAAADLTEKRAVRRVALTRAVVEMWGVRVGPMLIRATDSWDPDGIRLEVTFPRDEARLDGDRIAGWIAGRIDLRLPPGGAAAVRAELEGRDLVVRHPAIARRPVGPGPLALSGAATWEPGSIAIDRLTLASHDLRAEANGRWTRDGASVALRLPRTDCAAALASLPEGLAPTLAGMRLGGTLEASVLFAFERERMDDARLEIGVPAICRVLDDPPGARTDRVGERVAALRSYGRHVPNAFRVAEDLNFFRHRGFDVEQIRRALIHNLKEKAFRRGASTISQQVVKNVFLGHERTLSRKLQEAVLTWRMEQVVSKRRILEAYLDLVELGPGLRGVEAAARAYFGRSAKELTPRQAVHLAALAPAPRTLSRQMARGVSAQWRGRLDDLLDSMRLRRLLSPADWLRARAERLQPLPQPSLARR